MENIYIILFLFIIVLGTICLEKKFKKIENWEVYRQKPYGFIRTGSSPLTFYERPRYRKPYRYDYKINQTYPVNHDTHLL